MSRIFLYSPSRPLVAFSRVNFTFYIISKSSQAAVYNIAKNCIIQVVTLTEQSPPEGENHPTTQELSALSGTPNFVTVVISIR
jgi:hypothetical protein